MKNEYSRERRNLLKGSAALSALGLFPSGSYPEALDRFAAMENALAPTAGRLLKVGILGCEKSSSHIDTLWGPLINPPKDWTRVTGMTMTHVWDLDPAVARAFAERYEVPNVVRNFDEMAGAVDGIIMSGFKASFWFLELSLPYLASGTPIFINRPFAYSLARAREIVESARSHNTPIMCGDSHEYVKEVNIIRAKAEELKPLWGAMSDNSMSDYPSHGIHGLYFLIACLGSDVRRVSYLTPDWRKPGGVMSLEYEAHPGGHIWYASQQEISTGQDNAWIRLYGKDDFEQTLWWERGEWDRLFFFFLPPLLAMQKMFETRRMPESYDNILKKTQIFLAGFKSCVDHGGAPVALAGLPEDWTAPNMFPDYIPDGFFG